MSTARYIRWQDDEMWLGYFEEFPDYLTQGESLKEVEENLLDLYRDLTSGEIQNGVRSGDDAVPATIRTRSGAS
jgi:predicted RNase H-like HicB family nuclease